MNKIIFFFLFVSNLVMAQSNLNNVQSIYNPHDLFAPLQYPVGDNNCRSAMGEPSLNYWQNKADYNINVRLDENKKEIKDSRLITE